MCEGTETFKSLTLSVKEFRLGFGNISVLVQFAFF